MYQELPEIRRKRQASQDLELPTSLKSMTSLCQLRSTQSNKNIMKALDSSVLSKVLKLETTRITKRKKQKRKRDENAKKKVKKRRK